jgi:sterol desaturase/sphingolipid hydroxylase (fatty acid hydroxylase superfamily)
MTTTNYVYLLIAAILIAEIIKGRHRDIYQKEDFWILGGCLLLSRGITQPLIFLGIAKVFALILPQYTNSLANTPIVPALIVMVLVGECIFYWVHRAAHNLKKHPLLYGMHHTHHSASFINIGIMARVNIFWGFFQPYTWVIGAGFYLGMAEAATLFFIGMLAWNAFTHTHFRWDDAIINRFSWGAKCIQIIELAFVTPRIHHTHHGLGKDGKAYRNFCTMVTFYDRLFNTLFIPQGRPEQYGIMGAKRQWLQQIMFPLYIARRKTATKSQHSA